MDTAKETFEVAIGRAQYLLKLAEGLTNRRQRGTRKDWSKKFKKLMHWPQSDQIQRIDSKDVVLATRNDSRLTSDDFDTVALDDLRRAALVMAVSAMDAYFHAKVMAHVIEHSKCSKPSSRLLNESIRVEDFIKARKHKYKNAPLRAAIERKLSFQSLQQPDKVKGALQLIGVSGFWNSVAGELAQGKKDPCDQMSKMVKRRNQIVHEGDLSQSKKARNKARGISDKSVREWVELAVSIVNAADKVINGSLKQQ